jgi:mannose-6-phosphate isomerase-like protein (cupin superfamily)
VAVPRRVVTGHDAAGHPVVVSDGSPPHAFEGPTGVAAADVWSLAGPVATVDDGFEPEGGFPIEPPPGGLWWRYVRLPVPDQAMPREQQFLEPHGGTPGAGQGMHATATLDVCVILDGSIELDTESGSTLLGPGDCVVQQGTQHRWRVVGDRPCSYLVALLSPVPGATPAAPGPPPRVDATAALGPRRVVVGPGPDGRSTIVADGRAPVSVPIGSEAGIVDLWHTHGPLHGVVQGGDALAGAWDLEPGAAVAWRFVQLAPSPAAHLHRTRTIDLDVLLDGELELVLPDQPPVRLTPGDCVIQRGTEHAWRNTGDRPAQLLALMIGVPPAP